MNKLFWLLSITPLLITALSFFAGSIYLGAYTFDSMKSIWPAIYWFSATMLNVAVIFGMKG